MTIVYMEVFAWSKYLYYFRQSFKVLELYWNNVCLYTKERKICIQKQSECDTDTSTVNCFFWLVNIKRISCQIILL